MYAPSSATLTEDLTKGILRYVMAGSLSPFVIAAEGMAPFSLNHTSTTHLRSDTKAACSTWSTSTTLPQCGPCV
jgi:hypothetical protein